MLDIPIKMSPPDAAKLVRRTTALLELESSTVPIDTINNILRDLEFASKYIKETKHMLHTRLTELRK